MVCCVMWQGLGEFGGKFCRNLVVLFLRKSDKLIKIVSFKVVGLWMFFCGMEGIGVV